MGRVLFWVRRRQSHSDCGVQVSPLTTQTKQPLSALTIVPTACRQSTNGAQVADSLCDAGSKPSTVGDCNTDACVDLPVLVTGPPQGTILAGGTAANITWTGGAKYSQVSIEYRLLMTNPLAGMAPAESDWSAWAAGPTVDNGRLWLCMPPLCAWATSSLCARVV